MTAPVGPVRPLRADARRNRDRIVAAATQLVLTEGVDVPMSVVARRAGVGVATLYRRFPNRRVLAETVAVEACASIRREALSESTEDTPTGSMRRFLLAVARMRVGVVMSGLHPLLGDFDEVGPLADAQREMLAAVEAAVDLAKRRGELRADVSAEELMLVIALLTRPLPGVEDVPGLAPRLLMMGIEGLEP